MEEEFPGLRHLQGKQRREVGGLQMPGEEASESVMASKQQFGGCMGMYAMRAARRSGRMPGPPPRPSGSEVKETRAVTT